MKSRKLLLIAVVIIILAACSNPLNRQSSESAFVRDEDRPDHIKQEIKDRYQDRGFTLTDQGIQLEEISDPHLKALFAGIVFYHAFIYISVPPEEMVIASDGLNTYFLTFDFNLMINDNNIEITEQKILEIAFTFAKVADPASIPYLEMDRESVVITHEEAWPYIVSFQTYSALGGIVTNWTFWIDRWNNVQKIDETLVAKDVAEFIEPPTDYHKYWRSIGIPKLYVPQTK